jgi:hypothetical protein
VTERRNQLRAILKVSSLTRGEHGKSTTVGLVM